jgi:hypothetical protein
LGKFLPFGLLFKGSGKFWGKRVAQESGDIFGYFFTAIFLHFHFNTQFQSMVCCRDFKVIKVQHVV